jgi:hypothetical protein
LIFVLWDNVAFVLDFLTKVHVVCLHACNIIHNVRVHHHLFFFLIALGIVGWCIQQDGTVRRKLAKLLENRTDVHFVNSLPSEEGVEQVFILL